jgi:Protein of unknown function (DUF2971)
MTNIPAIEDPEKNAAFSRNPMPSVPLLYHYTGRVDPDSLLKIIAAELFYFSNPMHFNDALDMRMPIQPIKTNENSPCYRIIAGNKAQLVNVFDTQPPELIDFISSMIGETGAESIETIRVLCTTEQENTPLMWSHYGNRHQGVCFGLDWNYLKNKMRIPFKVHYQDEFSLSEHDAARFSWEFNPLSRTKTTDWAHENEWRFFSIARSKDEACFIPLRSALKTVTLGCHVSRETRKLVYSLVNKYKPNVEIRQIDIVNGQFQSNILPIPENFNGLGANQVSAAINEALNEYFNSGNTDEFISSCIPYFFHLDELGLFWMPIIAAASLTRNQTLRNRVAQWCPEALIARTNHARAVDFDKASDEIDIWSAYFSYLESKGQQNCAAIENLNSNDDSRSMTLGNKRLFLTIGFKLVCKIEKNSESTKSKDLAALCKSNLKMAKKINAKNEDVEICIAMLNKFSPNN